MLRPVDRARLSGELVRMRRLNEDEGIPLLGDYFARIEADGWLDRNPQIYHLYENGPTLLGYCGLVPLYPASYEAFRSGARFPVRDIVPEDMLTGEEYARARTAGVYIWMESFCFANAAAKGRLQELVFDKLSELNMDGMLVASSTTRSEEDCRAMGLIEAYESEPCPTGIRRL